MSGGTWEGTAVMGRKQVVEQQLLELFLSEGFTHLTVETIAARLSCSKATLYSIARNREELVRHELGLFFKTAAERADEAIHQANGPRQAIQAYLHQIAKDLRPASDAFMNGLASYPPARAVYELNTRIAAEQVRMLVKTGCENGTFRRVNAAFVGEVVTAAITKIHQGQFAEACGMTDADAFDALADLILSGVDNSTAS